MEVMLKVQVTNTGVPIFSTVKVVDAVEVVRCKDCKHRPFVPEGETYKDGFSIVSDKICPCVCADGWYSWIPPDNHYCSYGELKGFERF